MQCVLNDATDLFRWRAFGELTRDDEDADKAARPAQGTILFAIDPEFDRCFAVPRQLGLDIIVQPSQIGPFKFGVSTEVQTGRLDEPVAFSITTLHARNDECVQQVREGSRASLIDMLKMDGFIGATTATIGHRMVTISAWDSPEASRRVMKEGAHAEVQKGMYDGSLASQGFTSVWTKARMNPLMVRCDGCGKMTRGPEADRKCKSCGEALPAALPFW